MVGFDNKGIYKIGILDMSLLKISKLSLYERIRRGAKYKRIIMNESLRFMNGYNYS